MKQIKLKPAAYIIERGGPSSEEELVFNSADLECSSRVPLYKEPVPKAVLSEVGSILTEARIALATMQAGDIKEGLWVLNEDVVPKLIGLQAELIRLSSQKPK